MIPDPSSLLFSPWMSLVVAVLVVVSAGIVVVIHEHRRPPLSPEDREPATAGAQRQIDDLRERVHGGLRTMFIAGMIFVLGLGFTGFQIGRAFDRLDEERLARVGALASVNTFLCQRIDRVGNGVAALVAVNLRSVPANVELTAGQRIVISKFKEYVDEQERPPRCRQLARQVATLTGADPAQIHITPIHLHPSEQGHKASSGP